MKTLRLVSMTALFAASMFAADFTGTWTGVVKLPAGNNAKKGGPPAPLPFIVHIKQAGDNITGRMDGIGGTPDVEIQNGKVSGDTITYEGVRQINNMDVKFNYTATLSGETLEFKIVRADGGGVPLSSSTTRLTPVF